MAEDETTDATDYSDKTVEELDALMRVESGEVSTPVEPAAEPATETVTEPIAPPEQDAAPEPPAGSETNGEAPPVDPIALMQERLDAEKAAFEAKLALQMAHNSRLAGEIGYLRQKFDSKPSEPYTPETQADEDRLATLQARLDQFERQQMHEAANRAVVEVSQEFQPMFQGVDPKEFEAVAGKYSDQWKEALDASDPNIARTMTRAVLATIAAEVKTVELVKKQQALMSHNAAAATRIAEQKKAAAISGSGAAPPQRPQPKSYDDMTVEELGRELTRLYGSR